MSDSHDDYCNSILAGEMDSVYVKNNKGNVVKVNFHRHRRLKMSNTTDKMLDRYVYLHIEPSDLEYTPQGVTIHVKLDDEGVVVDVFSFKGGTEDECIATTCKTYNDMGVELKEIDDE